MSNKIKVCFVVPSLRAGGAERVMSFIAENLDSSQFNSVLVVIGFEKDKSYETNNIPVVFLGKERVRGGVWPIIEYLKSNKPDIVVSAMTHVNVLMALIAFLFPRIKFVGRETIVITGLKTYIKKKKENASWKARVLTKLQIRNLEAIICQSDDMRNDLLKNFGYPPNKLVVLNNPITKKFQLKRTSVRSDVKQFITVGRLVKQKGHLRVLKVLKQYNQPFHYTLIGSGPEEKTILDFIKKNDLKGKVTHVSFTTDVQSYLEKSDLFLQGSYVEGFPNALLETCTVGTPVVAYEALGGINEIIQEGINGYIAIDDEDFLQKLRVATTRNWSAKEIHHSVTSRYAEDIILDKYQKFFKGL